MKKLFVIAALLFTPVLSFAANSSVYNACTGCFDYVGSGSGSGGSSIYPATSTASFPFGVTSSTVAASTITVSGEIILPDGTVIKSTSTFGGSLILASPNQSVQFNDGGVLSGSVSYTTDGSSITVSTISVNNAIASTATIASASLGNVQATSETVKTSFIDNGSNQFKTPLVMNQPNTGIVTSELDFNQQSASSGGFLRKFFYSNSGPETFNLPIVLGITNPSDGTAYSDLYVDPSFGASVVGSTNTKNTFSVYPTILGNSASLTVSSNGLTNVNFLSGAGLSSCSGGSNAVIYFSSSATFGCNTISGGGGSGSPAAPFNSVQFNSTGTFNGSPNFTTDGSSVTVSTMVVGVGGIVSSATITVGNGFQLLLQTPNESGSSRLFNTGTSGIGNINMTAQAVGINTTPVAGVDLATNVLSIASMTANAFNATASSVTFTGSGGFAVQSSSAGQGAFVEGSSTTFVLGSTGIDAWYADISSHTFMFNPNGSPSSYAFAGTSVTIPAGHVLIAGTYIGSILDGGALTAGVTSVTGTAPINSSGGTTPVISLSQTIGQSETLTGSSFTVAGVNGLVVTGATTGPLVTISSVPTGVALVSVSSAPASAPSDGVVTVSSQTGTITFQAQYDGHLVSSGTAPSMGTCGSTPSVIGTDTAGVITVGSGVVTSCTMNFANVWANPPVCVESDNSTAVTGDITTTTTSSITFGFSATLGGGQVNFICIGQKG